MKIVYERRVFKIDIPKIDIKVKKKIKSSIEKKLLVKPEYYSIPLKGTLKPLRKFRVGNYRIIHTITDNIINVYAIIHRDDVYKKVKGITQCPITN